MSEWFPGMASVELDLKHESNVEKSIKFLPNQSWYSFENNDTCSIVKMYQLNLRRCIVQNNKVSEVSASPPDLKLSKFLN